jgi:RHS repeat-associated protein
VVSAPSVIASVDGGGTVTKFGYQPFGQTASLPPQFGFTGQRPDQETGLYYYRARHYSPEWGRFTQPDPIGYQGGANLYAYVYNDPLNLLDPEGLSALQAIETMVRPYNDFYQSTFGAASRYLFAKPVDDVSRILSRAFEDPGAEALTALKSIPQTRASTTIATAATALAGTRIVVDTAGRANVVAEGVEFSIHAAKQASVRNISIDRVATAMREGVSFSYVQNGLPTTGYYDWVSNTFVGVGSRITTVVAPGNPSNYLQNVLGRTE